MALNILVEKSYKDSLWCRQLLRSITDEATAKRYDVNVIASDRLHDTDFDQLYRDSTERRLLFCICTSIEAIMRVNDYISQKNIHPVLINHSFFGPIENYSCISMDFAGAMKNILQFLINEGRKKIALYGVNPNSTTDMIKKISFSNYLKAHSSDYDESSVFYNRASLDDCYEQFDKEKGSYDAVVCANDIVAISLLYKLKQARDRVPDDKYVISFGDTILSKIHSPSLTNASVDLYAIGRQVVYLYSYLKKREDHVSATISIRSDLMWRESTASALREEKYKATLLPFGSRFGSEKADAFDDGVYEKMSFYHNINFYDDPLAAEILQVEDLLCCMNEFDFDILSGMLGSESTNSIANRYYSSQQAISYRVKRMCQIIGCNNKKQLLDILKKYVSCESLKNYRPNTEYRI